MDAEKYFKEMYFNIWQSNDLSKIADFYAKDFKEVISIADEEKKPVEIIMDYNDIVQQANWQMKNYKEITINIKKIIIDKNNHLSVNFYSSSINKTTDELRHRSVCGIWRLNKASKIDRVWAVVTPYDAPVFARSIATWQTIFK